MFEREYTGVTKHSLIQTLCKCLIQQTKLYMLRSLPATRHSAGLPLLFVESQSTVQMHMLQTVFTLSVLWPTCCSDHKVLNKLCFSMLETKMCC